MGHARVFQRHALLRRGRRRDQSFQNHQRETLDRSGRPDQQHFSLSGDDPQHFRERRDNGIVWAVENTTPSVLHAYDASNLHELYNSNQAGSRDQLGAGNKFITPTIVNGKVFVGTTNSVEVFGLLP